MESPPGSSCLFLYRRRSAGLGEQREDSLFLLTCLLPLYIQSSTATNVIDNDVQLSTNNQLCTFYRVVCGFSSGDWQLSSRPFYFFSLFLPICIFPSCHPWTCGVVDVYASSRMKTTTHLSSASRPTSSKSQRTLLPVSHFNTFGVTVLSPECIRWSQNHCST